MFGGRLVYILDVVADFFDVRPSLSPPSMFLGIFLLLFPHLTSILGSLNFWRAIQPNELEPLFPPHPRNFMAVLIFQRAFSYACISCELAARLCVGDVVRNAKRRRLKEIVGRNILRKFCKIDLKVERHCFPSLNGIIKQ